MNKSMFYEDGIAYVIRPRKSWRDWRLYVYDTKVIMRIEDEIVLKIDKEDYHYHIERYGDSGLEASCDLLDWKDVIRIAGEKHKNLLNLARNASSFAHKGACVEITKYDGKYLFVTDHYNHLENKIEWPIWLKVWLEDNGD